MTALTITPDGQQLIAVGGIGLAAWNLPIQSDGSPAIVVELPEAVTSVEMTPDGDELVYATSGTEFLYRIPLPGMHRQEGSHPYHPDHLKPNHPIIAMSKKDEVLIAEQ